MNSGFDQNQSEFAVNVLTVTFQMLADADGSLDQVVKILWDVWFQSNSLHDSEDFVSVHETDLGNTMRVTKNNTLNKNKGLMIRNEFL